MGPVGVSFICYLILGDDVYCLINPELTFPDATFLSLYFPDPLNIFGLKNFNYVGITTFVYKS